MLDTMVQDIASCCQIPIKAISFKDLWLESPPADAAGRPLNVYLRDVSFLWIQRSVPKASNRPVKTHLSTTFIIIVTNFALCMNKDITERLSRTKLLVGDGIAPFWLKISIL